MQTHPDDGPSRGRRTASGIIHDDHEIRHGHESRRVPVLYLSGDLADAAARELADLIDHHLDAVPHALVLDLTDTSRLGLAVAEMLTVRARRAGEADIGFYLVAGSGPVRESLYAADGSVLLDVNATLAAALRAAL